MKRLHASVAGLGLVLLSIGAWWWQQGRPASLDASPGRVAPAVAAPKPGAAGPVPVEVALVVARDLTDDTTAVGSLRSRQGVVIRPEVSGRVLRLGFVDGQRVKQGQLLLQLDDALQQAQLGQAQAQLQIARTTLRRNRELVAQNFVTQSVVDQAQASVDVAEAQVALARAQLEKLRILAPFEGQAGIRAVDVGDYLKDGAAVVSLEDTASVYVDFSLPERFASRLKPQQKVEVTLDALPGERHDAVVLALEPQITADGRSIAARASLPNPSGRLRPGMFARVRVVLAQRPGALVVPEQAIVPLAGQVLLIKVVEGPAGPTSQRVEVRTGLRRDGEVEIVSGLVAGDQVVTAGHSRLLRADAQRLKLVSLGPPPAAPASASAPAAALSGPASAPRPAGQPG